MSFRNTPMTVCRNEAARARPNAPCLRYIEMTIPNSTLSVEPPKFPANPRQPVLCGYPSLDASFCSY